MATSIRSMVAVFDQLWTMGFEDFPATEVSALSDTFSIGHDGVAEFEVRTAIPRTDPDGEWTSPEVLVVGSNPIERSTGVGAWTVCGDFYVEVLSLDDDYFAAQAVLLAIEGAILAC